MRKFLKHSILLSLGITCYSNAEDMNDLKLNVSENRNALVSISAEPVNSGFAENSSTNLLVSPPLWKTISLKNSGNGVQSWAGETQMILVNNTLYLHQIKPYQLVIRDVGCK